MAVAHDRPRDLKKGKSATKGGNVTGQGKTELAAQCINISAKSSDSELDSVKVSEMLDSTTGGLADVQRIRDVARSDVIPAASTAEQGTIAELETQADTMTKSARKRAALKKKKKRSTDLASKHTASEPILTNIPALDWSEQPMDAATETIPLIQSPNVQATINGKSKFTKSKFSKEEKAEYRAKKAEAARLSQHVNENVEVAEIVAEPASLKESLESATPPALTTKRKKDKSQHKSKKSVSVVSENLSTSQYESTDPEARTTDSCNDNTKSIQTEAVVPGPRTTNTTRRSKQPINSTAQPIVGNKHSRHKSMDVRLRLNGQNHKTLSVDSPQDATTSPSRSLDKQPLKIKLPGKDVTFVYPEEFSRSHSKASRGRSHATSISSQYSGPSIRGGHDMRSRQSSHTTVGTSSALEHKLHSMIVSHSADSAVNLSTTSLSSEPATRSSRCLSPADIHSTSHSAPPMEFSVSSQQAPPSVPQMSTLEEHVINPAEVSDNLKAAVPAIPTVFEARSSQLHAPPSLGPPQPQNLPEQIPGPYQGNNTGHPNNNTPHYNSQYHMQNPYYNYYPMAPQMYNTFPMPSPGLSQPCYDQPMPINGMIYYNPDGTQAYPQEYYQYPPIFMNPYQQQHYDY